MQVAIRSILTGSLAVAGSAALSGPIDPYIFTSEYLRGTLAWVNVDNPYGDFSYFVGNLDGETRVNNVLVFGEIGFYKDDSYSASWIGIGAGYDVTPNVMVGGSLFFEYDDHHDDYRETSVFAQYSNAYAGFALSFYEDNDGDNYTVISGDFMVNDHTTVSGFLYNDEWGSSFEALLDHKVGATTYSVQGYVHPENDFRAVNVSVEHELSDRTKVFAGIAAESGCCWDGKTFGLGGGYKIAENTWLEGSVSRYDNNDGYEDTKLALSLHYDIGKSARVEQRVGDRLENVFEVFNWYR